VKAIRETFTDLEHEQLKSVKGDDRTWREAILEEFGVGKSGSQ